MLVRLLYASRIAEGVGSDVVDSILQKSRSRNPQLGITGVLCHDGNVFIQALEGGRNVVCSLYNRIAADPRHKDVILLRFDEINERCFAGWTMGLVSLKSVTPCLLLRYSERAELDPYSLAGSVSLELLKELIATAQVVGRSN